MTKQITIEVPDNAEVDTLHVQAGDALYCATRIAPNLEHRHLALAWWSVSRHGGDRGLDAFPLDPDNMRTVHDAMAAVMRDVQHGAGISSLIAWVCDLADAGRDRSDERAARKHAIAVAVACQ